MLYRDFVSQQEIDAEYDVGARRADVDAVGERMAELSAQARADLPGRLDLRYGPTRAERLDLFGADGPGPHPLLVFIHGGYWRAYEAADWALAARGPLAHGLDVAVVNYALAPAVTIDEITRQSRAAVAWLWSHASELGVDRSRIVVAGHSAGGHQAAMVLATEWERDYGLPADVVSAGAPISGVFDLRPLPYSYLAPALQLSRRTIETQSPLLTPMAPAPHHPPRIVAWGGGETSEFVRQSREYAAACRAAGIDARELVLGDDDHFDAVLALNDPASELTTAIAALARPR